MCINTVHREGKEGEKTKLTDFGVTNAPSWWWVLTPRCTYLFVCLGGVLPTLAASLQRKHTRIEWKRLYKAYAAVSRVISICLRLLSLLNVVWQWDFPKCHLDKEVDWERVGGERWDSNMSWDGLVIVQQLFITAAAVDISPLCLWSIHILTFITLSLSLWPL